MAHTNASPKRDPVRTLTLARIEAAYGPLYVVICIDDDDAERKTRSAEQSAMLWIDSIARPSDLFQNVVAVFKDGRNEPMCQFTAVKSVVVPLDFDFDKLSRDNSDGKWRAFFDTGWEHPEEFAPTSNTVPPPTAAGTDDRA